jgi:hypothetical protein
MLQSPSASEVQVKAAVPPVWLSKKPSTTPARLLTAFVPMRSPPTLTVMTALLAGGAGTI